MTESITALEELLVRSTEFFSSSLTVEADRELAYLTARAIGAEQRVMDLEAWLTTALEEAESWKRIALKLDDAITAFAAHSIDP